MQANALLDKDEILEKKQYYIGRILSNWVVLQEAANYLIDSSKAPKQGGKEAAPGIRQLLEKKEGLFRKHMMGKRVNYAARFLRR